MLAARQDNLLPALDARQKLRRVGLRHVDGHCCQWGGQRDLADI